MMAKVPPIIVLGTVVPKRSQESREQAGGEIRAIIMCVVKVRCTSTRHHDSWVVKTLDIP